MLYHSTTLFILEKIKEYYLDAVNQKNLEYTSFKELSMPPPKNESFSLLKGGAGKDEGKEKGNYTDYFYRCFMVESVLFYFWFKSRRVLSCREAYIGTVSEVWSSKFIRREIHGGI